MCKEELHALAEQVLRDRLVGFAVTGATDKGRVNLERALPATEAEQAWDALRTHGRARLGGTVHVHPAVVKLARQFRAAA